MHLAFVDFTQQERARINVKHLSNGFSKLVDGLIQADFDVALKVCLASFSIVRHIVELELFRRVRDRHRDIQERIKRDRHTIAIKAVQL